MRLRHFEALKPVCPSCRLAGSDSPITLDADRTGSGDDVASGFLRCTASPDRHVFPIVHGAPILTPDPAEWLRSNLHLLLQSDPETAALEDFIGLAVEPGAAFNMVRQQQSSYGQDHFGDLFGDAAEAAGSIRRVLAAALEPLPAPRGPVLDLGCGVGRTTFDLAERGEDLVLGLDLNWPLLKIGRGILDHGRIRYPHRRTGMRFARRESEIALPGAERVDFWIADALCLPFAASTFGQTIGLNLLDCVTDPPRLVAEMVRSTAAGGSLALATPFDWATYATPPAAWLDGPDAVLELLVAESRRSGAFDCEDLIQNSHTWTLRLHESARMSYRTNLFCILMQDVT